MKLIHLIPLALLAASPAFAADHAMSHDMGSHSGHDMSDHTMQAALVAEAEGVLNSVDAAKGSANLSHGPIAVFNWPPMTMDLKLESAALVKEIPAGSKVRFKLKKLSAVEYVIVGMERVK